MCVEQPELASVDLAEHEIEDLTPLVPILGKFEHLTELNLSNNFFTHLPMDLSCLRILDTINLSNVHLEDFEASVHALSTLPSLRSLYVNLFEEAQVDLIMRILPDLEFLNGLAVDREALNESTPSVDQRQNKHQVPEPIQEEEAEATVDEQQPHLEPDNSLSMLHSSH